MKKSTNYFSNGNKQLLKEGLAVIGFMLFLALIAVAPTPVLATEASESLIGQKPSRSIFEKAASVAKETISPITDVRGSAAQRKHLIGVLTRRCLDIAVNRAGYGS